MTAKHPEKNLASDEIVVKVSLVCRTKKPIYINRAAQAPACILKGNQNSLEAVMYPSKNMKARKHGRILAFRFSEKRNKIPPQKLAKRNQIAPIFLIGNGSE